MAALCKYCSEVNYNELIRKAKSRNIKGSALASIDNHRKEITYIHRPSFSKHVGDAKSLHNWCKKKILPNETASIGKETQGCSSSPIKS